MRRTWVWRVELSRKASKGGGQGMPFGFCVWFISSISSINMTVLN